MGLARILVVEDDEDVARLEQTVLERAGYEVRVTGSGAEGLELAEGYKPDVVVLDVGLPDISGLDVCTSLSNSNNAFILMVSGHSREQDILLGLGLGADDYITKPFSGNELVARVASFLRRREKSVTRPQPGNLLGLGTAQLDRDFHTLTNNGTNV
ncbi:MAG TPA: response regulator transcription factor, partial [Candidatus Baltobacteraceae bacterium]|nr:response regulator transcription factor [Candidatus Baltobacteraceae bacterium]